MYYLILPCYFENHSSGLKANLGGKLPTIVVAMFPSLFSCYNNIKNKPNKVALTYCWYVQCFGKQKYLMNDWLTKRLKSRYQYFGIQSNNLEWRHVCFKIRILMENIYSFCAHHYNIFIIDFALHSTNEFISSHSWADWWKWSPSWSSNFICQSLK